MILDDQRIFQEFEALKVRFASDDERPRTVYEVAAALQITIEDAYSLLRSALERTVLFQLEADPDCSVKLGDLLYEGHQYSEAMSTYAHAAQLLREQITIIDAPELQLQLAHALLKLGKSKSANGSIGFFEAQKALEICKRGFASSSARHFLRCMAMVYYEFAQLPDSFDRISQRQWLQKAISLCDQLVAERNEREDRRLLIDLYMGLDSCREVEYDCENCFSALQVSEALVGETSRLSDRLVLGSIYETIAHRMFDELLEEETDHASEAELYNLKAIEIYNGILEAVDLPLAKAGLSHCRSYQDGMREIGILFH